MEGRFVGREIIDKPQCPFCGILLTKPGELEEQTLHEMPVGRCQCGATYACDVTGHDLGNAMIEALVLSCNDDWNRAWDRDPAADSARPPDRRGPQRAAAARLLHHRNYGWHGTELGGIREKAGCGFRKLKHRNKSSLLSTSAEQFWQTRLPVDPPASKH